MPDVQYMRKRTRLVDLLGQAAELEHALCCQYLYAAFALKQDPGEGGVTWEQLEYVRRWKGNLLLIARQEMVHLATTSNLLTAVGEAPHFWRPDFPTPSTYYPFNIGFELRRLDEAFLLNAIDFEKPSDPDDRFELGTLYAEAQGLVRELASIDERALFIGPAGAQVDNSTFLPSYPDVERSNRRSMWDMRVVKIKSAEGALRALQQMRDEGEGGYNGPASQKGHYQLLLAMLSDYRSLVCADPGFEPSRPVVVNPWREEDDGVAPKATGRTMLSDPCAVEVAGLFNLGYEVMLSMLILFFTQNALTRSGFLAIQQVAFLPLMSLVVRPLGEMLSVLPAFKSGGTERAGAPFRCSRRVHQLPHADPAWKLLTERLAELHDRSQKLASDPTVPVECTPRLAMLAENTWRIHANFASAVSGL